MNVAKHFERRRGVVRAVAAIALGPVLGFAPNAQSHTDGPPPQPTNLQVLPGTTSGQAVAALMRRYTRELGVGCSYCHVEDPVTQREDFPSDDNPRKQTARIMMGMVADINNRYLAQVGDRRYAEPISCGNCHRGQTSPPAFEPGGNP